MKDLMPWSDESECTVQNLSSSIEFGLTDNEAVNRLGQYGPNKIQASQGRRWFSILIAQFKSLLVLLLFVAAMLAFAFEDWIEGIAICAVLIINAMIGFFTELGAVRTMESLRKYNKTWALVRRGGASKKIPAERLVPGDIVMLEAGDMIAADLRITQCSRLEINESALTGESFPVSKEADAISESTILAERTNMLYKGTSVIRGTCEAIVTDTGLDTEFGKISSLVMATHDEETPLEKRLARLSRKLIVITLAITLFTLIAGVLRGKELYLMIETSIALAVAAIPEGLPIIATLALARGMWRMAKSNALINRLSAVETLGATNIICTDKTGTLTENHMVLISVVTTDGVGDLTKNEMSDSLTDEAIKIGLLCNNAELEIGKAEKLLDSNAPNGIGDPMELALLSAAAKRGLAKQSLLEKYPRHHEEAFDSDLKMMATVHSDGEEYLFAVKGAAEPVIDACSMILTSDGVENLTDEQRKEWLLQNHQLATDGFRVLALAEKHSRDEHAEPYAALTFIALACVMDPSRADVPAAIRSCMAAGIRVVMITGDQVGTALHVAKNVGICASGGTQCTAAGKDIDLAQKEHHINDLMDVSVFARVTPKNKLDIIEMHQKQGSVVAMTGDGVNDAPALKKADIGIAMGIRGTEVARESADMVLRDDAFTTIVSAVEQGRVIFTNIRKFVVYLMSCNLSEVLVVGLVSMTNAPLPLLPLQILFLNMVTDVFPALALGACKGHTDVMSQPPRSVHEPIVGKHQWHVITLYSLLITVSVLTSFTLARLMFDMSNEQAVTISFLVIAFCQIFHVFNMAEPESHPFDNEITRNPYVWSAVIFCTLLLLAAVMIQPFAQVLHLEMPDLRGWIMIIIASLIPLAVGRITAFFKS